MEEAKIQALQLCITRLIEISGLAPILLDMLKDDNHEGIVAALLGDSPSLWQLEQLGAPQPSSDPQAMQ